MCGIGNTIDQMANIGNTIDQMANLCVAVSIVQVALYSTFL
jgi:hypothetical protein